MILTNRAPRRIVPVVVLAALATACGSDSAEPAEGDGSAPLVATTSIWADITSRVACGEDVTALVPRGADPHAFEPSLQDRELLDDAGMVIANGNDLEESLVDLLDTVAGAGTNVVEMTTHVDVLVGATDDEHTDDDHTGDERTGEGDDGHGHAAADGGDPHVWQDPSRVAGALDVIASAVAATGRDAAAVEECTAAYRAELEALDADITAALAGIPEAERLLVTSHDSLAYFADRYDLEIVGSVIPSTSTIAESSAAELAELADRIRELGVPAVFTDALASSGDADALAARLGVEVVPLVTDSLTDDAATDTYVGMMRANAEAIAGALDAARSAS